MDRLRSYSNWILLAVAALAVWALNREHRAMTIAQRSAEAAQLALKNQIVEGQETRRQLQGSVAQLLAENADLRTAYDRAKEAAPDAQPASATQLDTGPLRVRKVPASAGVVVTPTQPPPAQAKPEAAPADTCLLQPDDTISVEALVLELETDQQNTVVVGSATVYRDTPAPRLAIASGAFQSSLSTSHEVAPPSPPRWGAELVGACFSAGCGYGGGVLLPPFRVPLFGWRGEARVDALFAGPATGVLGALGARW